MTGLPWTFEQAETRSKDAEVEQRRVESEVSQAYRTYARAERTYKVALSRRILELKAAGMAITACETVAKGDERIAMLREERDIAEGLKETARVAAWRVNADRRDVNDLLNWSSRRDLAEFGGRAPSREPESLTTYGGVRA